MTATKRAPKTDGHVENESPPVDAPMDENFSFEPSGVITLTRKTGQRLYIRQTSFEHFLNHIKENEPFTYRHIPLTPDERVWGSQEFRLVLAFLRACKLVEKGPGGYLVKSIRALKDAWNRQMDATKL